MLYLKSLRNSKLGESRDHIFLVTRIVNELNSFPQNNSFHIFVDGPDYNAQNRPPQIGSFIPDVYARNLDVYDVIVGEG